MTSKKRRKKRIKVAWILALVAVIGVGGYIFFESNIRGRMVDISTARAQALAVYAMNDAVHQVLDESFDYDQLMDIVYDQEGNVTLIQADTLNMNRLSTLVVARAQRNIEDVGDQGVGVRLGTVIGGSLFSGQGPMLYVSMTPVGSVSAAFDSRFHSQGINQTRHEIYLTLTAKMRVIAPFQSQTIEAVTQVAVAESIIVGEIPDNYVNVEEQDDMLNLLPD